MNNEIGRKITSLTLMIIMVAGGLTFAIPGEMPTAHAATANLFVSAENSLFDNSFAGPMVIEVIINDPDLKEIDEAEAEPDVTVNDQDLRMVQATDGNWYAYFADVTMATAADAQATVNGTSLDFGSGCLDASTGGAFLTYTDSDGVYFPGTVTGGGTDGVLGTCGAFVSADEANVVRENKTAARQSGGILAGQVGVIPGEYPAIQLYDFTVDGSVTVKYNVGGPAQQIVLTYLDDADGYADLSTDRENYPKSASVHITVTDLQLNIDPTDEDSWTFATNGTAQGAGNRNVVGTATGIVTNGTETFYGVFNENGDTARSSLGASISAVGGSMPAIDMGALNFDDNGVLILDIDAQETGVDVLTLRDNNDQNTTGTTYSTAQFAGSGEGSGGSLAQLSGPVTLTETQANTGEFTNTDEGDVSNIAVTVGALRGTTATIDYNDTAESILVLFYLGELSIDEDGVGGEWNSGEDVGVTLLDGDQNLNSLVDEDLDLNNPDVIIPAIRIGSPITLAGSTAATIDGGTNDGAVGNRTTVAGLVGATGNSFSVDAFSDRGNFGVTTPILINSGTELTIFMDETHDVLNAFLLNGTTQSIYTYFNYDFRGLESNGTDIFDGATLNFTLANSTLASVADFLPGTTDFQGLAELSSSASKLYSGGPVAGTDTVDLKVNFTGTGANTLAVGNYTFVADFFSFGQTADGFLPSDRINNAIYRMELEESGDNTSIFEGSIEFTMLNQISVNDTDTYLDFISSIDSDVEMIIHNDLTDEDSVRVNYFDVDDTGIPTTTSDQIEAPTHSGVVSFDQSNYKVGDLVIVSLDDTDLNADVETVDIFTVVGLTAAGGAGEVAIDQVGAPLYGVNTFGDNFGRVLDITFDDELWQRSAAGGCAAVPAIAEDNGLGSTGFTLIEDAPDAGTFMGTYLIPSQYCQTATGTLQSVTGTDMEVNYVDYRDGSGEIIEVGDGAGIRANTGSVSLDRTVYPVPFGVPADFGGAGTTEVPAARSVFPVHQTGMTLITGAGTTGLDAGEFLAQGDLTIHVRINDPDFDISAAGEDIVGTLTNRTLIPSATGLAVDGPLKISVSRGASEIVLATAGGSAAIAGVITTLNATVTEVLFDATAGAVPGSGTVPSLQTIELGPITEVAPDAGIFELDMVVRYTDGPASATCPTTTVYTPTDGTVLTGVSHRFGDNLATHCILQGDIVTVEYTDPTDASGNPNTVTDSATFDLRNGVLQSDKSVYIIGSDAILTLIEPDFDLENDEAETYDLDLLEWDSDAATVTMGNLGPAVFDPEPSDLRETGDSTGIFQIVVEIPNVIAGDNLERGEEIVLEYTDWGPSGSDYVGDEDEDVNLTIFTSNFGATVELDQKVYSWTDKAFVTIVAPDHNFDSNLIDEIGDSPSDPIKISTRGFDIDNYRLVETGTDTGIFTGEVILTGFTHDADGDGIADAPTKLTSADGSGPTDGFLETDDDDGITVSFEFSEDETVVGSALIRWNIGEVQWLEASYPATGTGVVRIVDPDLNLNPESVDNFDVDVWSDSDAGGIDLTVTETNEATGIFEGTVFFTITDESSGHRLRVSEGDTITAEYEDNTLPDPYTTADELDITGTSIIGTVVPPLDRAPASGLRVVDAFANALASISVDQQVQITADLANGQDRDQPFAYLVQVQDGNGVTVALAWISGTLAPGQSFSPALSWTPSASGSYDITAFVWESVDNPTALSPPVSTTITVN